MNDPIKEHLKNFQYFHKKFYKDVRSFLVDGILPSDIPAHRQNLIERQVKYKILLQNKIEKFCTEQIATFLDNYHSIIPKFEKSENDEAKIPFRGLVFLHSREFGEGRKIAIPFGIWKSEQEPKITNQVFNLRHSVRHILGETMWRFFEPGKSKIPCVYFEENSELENYEQSCFIQDVKIKDSNFEKKITGNTRASKVFLSNPDWYKELYKNSILNNSTIRSVTEAMSEMNKWLPKGNLMFLIDGLREKYVLDDIQRLLANPIRHANISDAKNIFYIPDIHRSEITGGLVCELSLKMKDRTKNILDKLNEILSDLQWIFSNYVFAAISSCETEFGSGVEFTYSKKFFADNVSKSSKQVFGDFKEDIDKKLSTDLNLEKARAPLRYFFESVSEERGQYVRGYEDISKKAFVAVCKLWNDLEVYKVAGGMKIECKHMEELEGDIEKFRYIRAYQPELELLWVALDFEGTLKNVPSYREHFIHSFHVFCLGLWILSHNKFPYRKSLSNDNFLSQWFLTALWHDVSYAMQKLAEISNIFIKKLVTHGYERKKKGVLVPISPNWGHLLLAKDFYKLLLGEEKFQKHLIEALTLSTDIPNIMLDTMLNQAEHGILSGLISYHQLCNIEKAERKTELGKLKSKYSVDEWRQWFQDTLSKFDYDFKEVSLDELIPVITGIMLHHCYDWQWQDEGGKNKKGNKELKINIQKAPLAHLLILCDSLVQSGREFFPLEEKIPDKEMKIKFINIEGNEKNISIDLEYTNSFATMENIKKKHFVGVLKVLDLTTATPGQPVIKCVLVNSQNRKKPDSDDVDYKF